MPQFVLQALASLIGALIGSAFTAALGYFFFTRQKGHEIKLHLLRDTAAAYVELARIKIADKDDPVRRSHCEFRLKTNLLLCRVFFGERSSQALSDALDKASVKGMPLSDQVVFTKALGDLAKELDRPFGR